MRAYEAAYEAGNTNEIQSLFYEPKPLEQFFDTGPDPWQVDSLVEQPASKARVKSLSKELDRWMVETRDVGLIPELDWAIPSASSMMPLPYFLSGERWIDGGK
ncbi:hypothetical protein SAMN05192553_1065 [Cyclobacterium xiamenense]|uniref:Arylsulfatase n=1 Tax=Cyclobacterium xiamenense TaxID=1297121 RepID=A0A1H7A476_9BACT|nr:hypothetical protein SAMN05192553_1065 [Cyclobacterium xiamenense]